MAIKLERIQMRIRQQPDPWRVMAIENQFQSEIKEFEPLTGTAFDMPSTLTYLKDGISGFYQDRMDDGNFELYRGMYSRMDRTYEYLLTNLSYERYAGALMTVLWGGSEYTWDEMMELTLDTPGELLSEADGYGYTLLGM